MSGPPFAVERSDHVSVAVLRLTGELDLATAPALRAELEAVWRDEKSAVIDMAALDFVDSSGLAVFVAMWNKLAAQGATLALAGPIESARRVLQVTGIDGVIPVYADADEALRALPGG